MPRSVCVVGSQFGGLGGGLASDPTKKWGGGYGAVGHRYILEPDPRLPGLGILADLNSKPLLPRLFSAFGKENRR